MEENRAQSWYNLQQKVEQVDYETNFGEKNYRIFAENLIFIYQINKDKYELAYQSLMNVVKRESWFNF